MICHAQPAASPVWPERPRHAVSAGKPGAILAFIPAGFRSIRTHMIRATADVENAAGWQESRADLRMPKKPMFRQPPTPARWPLSAR
jgi:hypothetical protein